MYDSLLFTRSLALYYWCESMGLGKGSGNYFFLCRIFPFLLLRTRANDIVRRVKPRIDMGNMFLIVVDFYSCNNGM